MEVACVRMVSTQARTQARYKISVGNRWLSHVIVKTSWILGMAGTTSPPPLPPATLQL
jgi:hypothetical protein